MASHELRQQEELDLLRKVVIAEVPDLCAVQAGTFTGESDLCAGQGAGLP